MAYQTKITRARFVYSPFSSEQMHEIGTEMLDTMWTRIGKGLNCDDAPAKELKPGRNGKRGYPDRKGGHGLQTIRDLFFTGRTKRSTAVISASEHRAVIGPVDSRTDLVLSVNNRREKQWGISPKDHGVLTKLVLSVLQSARLISVRKAA